MMTKPSHSRWTPEGMLRHRRQRRAKKTGLFIAALGGAALIGGAAGYVSVVLPGDANSSAKVQRYDETLLGCSVTDGDTIRCGDERIRLLGIDAPELPGHCRSGRACAPGDPYASTKSLSAAMTGDLTIKRFGQDHYGRTLALVTGNKGDLSCWQLRHRQVIYKQDWDDDLNLARTCSLPSTK